MQVEKMDANKLVPVFGEGDEIVAYKRIGDCETDQPQGAKKRMRVERVKSQLDGNVVGTADGMWEAALNLPRNGSLGRPKRVRLCVVRSEELAAAHAVIARAFVEGMIPVESPVLAHATERMVREVAASLVGGGFEIGNLELVVKKLLS